MFRDGHTEVCVFKGSEGETEDAGILGRIIRESNRLIGIVRSG